MSDEELEPVQTRPDQVNEWLEIKPGASSAQTLIPPEHKMPPFEAAFYIPRPLKKGQSGG